MTTLDDQAAEREEQHREWAMTYRKPEAPRATGRCLNCDEPLGDERRFCDYECMQDFTMRTSR